MRSSRIWGIIKAEVCVICRSRRLRQITQTEALIFPHILRELNSVIVLLFICIYIGLRVKRTLKGGSYSHFPAQILTKSHRPTAQIPSSLCLSCSNLNPIPIFYCFFVDESQSQCMKSHFPSQKMGKSQFPFYPFRTLGKRLHCEQEHASC